MSYRVKWNKSPNPQSGIQKEKLKLLKKIHANYIFPLWGLGGFYFNSKNEHGVHSPFVFDLVTKCFYASEFPIENSTYLSTNKLILKTIHYLNLKNCVRFDVLDKVPTTIDGLIVSSFSLNDFSIEKILPFCKNETCIFIENIHQTKANEKIWKRLHQHETITCSIETFNLGFLFIRKEQKKEHFIINPNKTITSRIFERIRF